MLKRLNFYGITFLLLSIMTVSLGNSSLSSNEVYYIDSFSIDKQSASIASELRYNKGLRYGLVASALGLGSYMIVRLLAPNKPTAHNIPAAPIGTFSLDDVKNLMAMAQHYNTIQTKQKIGFMRTAFLVGKEMVTAVTQQLIVLVLFNSLNNSLGPVSKYIQFFDGLFIRTLEKIYHKGDLRWFIVTHTHCKDLLQELQEQSKYLVGKQNEQQEPVALHVADTLVTGAKDTPPTITSCVDCTVHKKIIASTWHAITQDVERILGFIHYKKSIMNKESDFLAPSIQEVIESVMHKTNECTMQVHEALQKAEGNSLITITKFYSDFLEESLQHFLKFEPLLV